MRITKDDIADLRGETPTMCDVCGNTRAFEELEPEEAGQWVCHDCMRYWLAKDVANIKMLLSFLYVDKVDRAKWWFTPKPYLGNRTPHEVILCNDSESLLAQLEQDTCG